MVDPDEYASWKDAPVTQWVMQALAARFEEIEQDFLHRFFLNQPKAEDVTDMQFMRGQADAFTFVMDATHGEIAELHAGEDEQ